MAAEEYSYRYTRIMHGRFVLSIEIVYPPAYIYRIDCSIFTKKYFYKALNTQSSESYKRNAFLSELKIINLAALEIMCCELK